MKDEILVSVSLFVVWNAFEKKWKPNHLFSNVEKPFPSTENAFDFGRTLLRVLWLYRAPCEGAHSGELSDGTEAYIILALKIVSEMKNTFTF